jgi:hypothetical protein
MRIAEAFCKMRLSDFCSSHDVDRAIAVTVDSFVGSQKVSCKKALARAFAKYVLPHRPWIWKVEPKADFLCNKVHVEETGDPAPPSRWDERWKCNGHCSRLGSRNWGESSVLYTYVMDEIHQV